MEVQGAAAQPWTTPIARVGLDGLQLNKALDQLTVQELARVSNLFHTGGALFVRPGMTDFATAAATIHSIRRLNDPKNATFIRFWGMSDGTWGTTISGAVNVLKSGFSGHPLTLLTVRPALSGEPWMMAADSSLMQKANRTGPSLPVGLPAPATPNVVVSPALVTSGATFTSSDGTQAANWTAFAVTAGAGKPTIFDATGITGGAIDMALVEGTAPSTGMLEGMCIPLVRDFSTLPGPIAATDDDFIHFAIRINEPTLIDEVRLYIVVSPFTADGSIPGTNGSVNQAAYVRAFRPSDYSGFIQGDDNALQAAETARNQQALDGITTPGTTLSPTPSSSGLAGSDSWTQFGTVGIPLRRSDFLKVGTAGQAGTDWSTITGLYITVQSLAATSVTLSFTDLWLTGGYGPDDADPENSGYDYRIIHFDPRTGARGNGSAVMTTTVDALRQKITVTPVAAYGDPAVRQELYRRGGTLTDNWFFTAVNTADGGPIVDTNDDTAIAAADTVPIDHFQPVATTAADGSTVLNQPVPIIFNLGDTGIVCALGDPYRPGHLYSCIAGEPDHWPSTGNYAVEVCPPSEELMNGCSWGDQGFVLSREKGYAVHANVTGDPGLTVTPAGCEEGLIARWGFCAAPGGIFFVSRAGIRVTNGGASQPVDGDADNLWPLFHNQARNGFLPIDFTQADQIRLSVYDNELWFLYQDVGATRRCLIYSLIHRYWRAYNFAFPVAVAYNDETQTGTPEGGMRLLLGSTSGHAYEHAGFTDNGTPIAWSLRTGAWDFGRPREEKRLGDLMISADLEGSTMTVQTYLDTESVANAAQGMSGGIGRQQYLFDPFGNGRGSPQHAKNVSVDISGSAPTAAQPSLNFLGVSYVVEPDVTMNRVTTWEPPGAGDTEGYVWGAVFDCDTAGTPRTILVEGDLAGVVTTIATLTVNTNGRHKVWFSWPAAHVQLIRLRPTGTCAPWMLFSANWLSMPEPPRIIGWDTNFEDLGDSYYTGLDIEADTFGQIKSFHVTVDQVEIPGSPFTIQTFGRTHVHFTFTPARGHIYRFYCDGSDGFPGLLYSHKWMTDPEPQEQTNWNQNFTTWASQSDKYLKGLVIEADTFNQPKTLAVQVDGVTLVTVPNVQHNGRLVKNYTFPQVLGRVFRILPTDAFPSRLYAMLPLFDEEPYALARWETQLLTLDLPESGWGSILSTEVCYRCLSTVTLTVQIYGDLGVVRTTQAYPLPATGGVKQKVFVPFQANKGVLFKLIFTADDNVSGLTLYQEESHMRVKPWASSSTYLKPYGDDDLDVTRSMTSAVAAANRSGGGS